MAPTRATYFLHFVFVLGNKGVKWNEVYQNNYVTDLNISLEDLSPVEILLATENSNGKNCDFGRATGS